MARTILVYVYALAGGGAERVVATLASGLAARGHRVTLATDFDAPEAAGLVSNDVVHLDLGRSHARAVLRLARHLGRARPDVSISATGVSNLKHVLAATLAGRLRRAVQSFHGHVEAEPGHLSLLGNRLAPVTTRMTGRSVFVSDDLLKSFMRRGASQARASRIYNPVPVFVSASTYAGLSAPPTILAVGRLVDTKGLDILLRALARLEDRRVRLTILGEGPERARLEHDIRTLGLAGRVDLPGWVDDTASAYAGASCFVCASRRESFGNVLVEALAHGLPVVSTDCGGPREILEAGRFGRLVPVDDAAAMATAIEAALTDPGDATGRRARAAEFLPEHALDAYEALIERVIAAAY